MLGPTRSNANLPFQVGIKPSKDNRWLQDGNSIYSYIIKDEVHNNEEDKTDT